MKASQSTPLRLRHSLFFQSLVLAGIFSALVMGLTGYAFVHTQSAEYNRAQVSAIDLILLSTGSTLGTAVWNFDERAATQSLGSLQNIEGFCGARVIDKNKAIFVTYKWGDQAERIAHSSNFHALARSLVVEEIARQPISFANPTKANQPSEVIGYLEVCQDHRTLLQFIDAQENRLFLIVMAVSILLVTIVATCLRIVFALLSQLGQAMENTKLGLQVITDTRLLKDNEVGALGKRFNSMIHDLAETHGKLEQKIVEVEESSRAKSLFLSNMSHELRTPMHAILNYSDMGLKQISKGESDKLQKYLTNIGVAGKRLLHLLNDLLDYSKFDAGKMILQRAMTPLESVANYAHQELESLFVKKNLRYIIDIRNGVSTTLDIDVDRLTQVLVNLFSNALKYSPEGEAIEVEIIAAEWKSAPALRLAVKNKGPHIAPDDLETIFELFMQSTSTRKIGGTGLGLCICRQIVEAHNGHIWAENLPDFGVAFYILLPVDGHLRHQTEK